MSRAPGTGALFPGIRAGLRGEREFLVADDMVTSHAGGPGVLTTPHLIRMMEDVASDVTSPLVPDDHTTVGFEVAIRHRAAAPVGSRVRVTAELLEANGHKLLFRVQATTDRGVVGEGMHRRTIIKLGVLGVR